MATEKSNPKSTARATDAKANDTANDTSAAKAKASAAPVARGVSTPVDKAGDSLVDRSANVPEQVDETGQDGHESQNDQLFADNPTVDAEQREELGRAPRPLTVNQLEGDEYTAAKQGSDVPVDGRYHKTFVTPKRRDWETSIDDDADMHRANFVATLQEAVNHGLHPQGETSYDGHEDTSDGSVRLNYSVEVIPAREDEAPSEGYYPRKAIIDMGGSTSEAAQVDPEEAKRAEALTQNDPNATFTGEPVISSTTKTPNP